MIKKNTFILLIFTTFLCGFNMNAQETNTDNEEIKALINKKRAYNKQFGFGYRIQLFNGLETSAKKIKSKFSIENPTIKTYLRYYKPEWKVRIGNYKTKLEADKALNIFKKDYPGAIIVPL
ncbi:MAG: SPOR domain-containing protein [Flavobacteriaceae bacterium]